MNIPDGVVPERFHPTTFDAGIPQVELPCYDPACSAEPGEACGSFCTHGEPNPAPGHEDLVPVEPGAYAVRHCPRCSGSGKDSASPDRANCRCRVDVLDELQMRAGKLYRQAQTEGEDDAARTLAEVRRLDAEALVAALTELGVSARVHLGSSPVYAVVIDTKFGRIFAGLDPDDDRRVLVQRVDATQWSMRVLGDVRTIAWTLRNQVPELAREGDRLDWVVAIMPVFAPDAVVCFVGRETPADQPCPFCSLGSVVCPGLRSHMWEVRNQYRGAPVTAIFGAFPVPADTPTGNAEAAQALDDAIRPLAHMVWRGALDIT
ncbi:hypothetical protein [Actinokineospora enzanensis]|uniref:hypothetical protein n=1 Tax=Actinokineospora enzanensis TaxID=155975 RepID=UPI00036F12A3|nr:hypothetical protein [Actinokineospora enzanensis]